MAVPGPGLCGGSLVLLWTHACIALAALLDGCPAWQAHSLAALTHSFIKDFDEHQARDPDPEAGSKRVQVWHGRRFDGCMACMHRASPYVLTSEDHAEKTVSNDSLTPPPTVTPPRPQAFYVQAEVAFRGHPLWKGASSDDLEQAFEGLEKYLMSKLWKLTFATTAEDRDRDDRCARLLGALSFVSLDTLTGTTGAAPDAALVGAAGDELLKADRYKAPRDKLVCLVNVKRAVEAVIQDVVGRGRTDLGGGADAFFPVLLLVVIRARPARLVSTVEFLKRFRGERRTRGQFDFMLANLESVALYVETVDYTHLRISKQAFLERLAAAGIPEAALELEGLAEAQAGEARDSGTGSAHLLDMDPPVPDSPSRRRGADSPPAASFLEPEASFAQDTPPKAPELSSAELEPGAGPDPAPPPSNVPPDMELSPVVSQLVHEGVAHVLQMEAEGKLQPRYPFMYADPEDLTLVRGWRGMCVAPGWAVSRARRLRWDGVCRVFALRAAAPSMTSIFVVHMSIALCL